MSSLRLPAVSAMPHGAALPVLPAALIPSIDNSVAKAILQAALKAQAPAAGDAAGVVLRQLGGSLEAADGAGAQQGVERGFGAAYDGSAQASSPEGNPASSDGGHGNRLPPSDNGGSGGSDGSGSADGSLGKLYPRVVMILDTLDGPASDKLVARIETLLDKRVHVVFVTARSDKGPNSAESVLVSRLKVRSGNPLIVVSYNGARIAAHNSKAEKPKGLVEDMPGFADNTITLFRKINSALKSKLGARAALPEFGVPSVDSAHLYGVELPAKADVKEAAAFYNRALSAGGYKYRMEGREDADGRK